jgi:hypothetical protein
MLAAAMESPATSRTSPAAIRTMRLARLLEKFRSFVCAIALTVPNPNTAISAVV